MYWPTGIRVSTIPKLFIIAILVLATHERWIFSAAGQSPSKIEFNRQVRTLLADRCFRCHGPDQSQLQAELRLDSRESATAVREGRAAIRPGNPDASELVRRLVEADPQLRMPPPESGEPLASSEIELLREWIRQGAEYEPFWSFVPPRIHVPPQTTQIDWTRLPLDRWILARLETAGWQPSPQATREMLARRLALDLTGLPLSIEELDSFVTNPAPDAYERLVDRLLASARYGERMAQFWLDAARYADTHGYFVDGERTMWRWRDWVIDAFNANQPFDEFTIEQLAGDLLPKATLQQQIATAFNRNHTATNETGVIDEEYRISYVMDRLETTGTIWLGLTLNCARCHSHKFDPISQHDYYRMLSFFNQVPEKGNIQTEGNSQPLISTPTDDQLTRLAQLNSHNKQAVQAWQAIEPRVHTQFEKWKTTADSTIQSFKRTGLLARFSFEEDLPGSVSKAAPLPSSSQKDVRQPAAHEGVLLASTEDRALTYGTSLNGRAVQLDGYAHAVYSNEQAFSFESSMPFTVGAWVFPTASSAGCIISKTDDHQFLRGFDLLYEKGKLVAHLNHRAESDAIRVRSSAPVATNRWQHVAIGYDGSGRASGLSMFIDGKSVATIIEYDNLRGSIQNSQPFRVGRRSDSLGFVGLIDEVNIFARKLEPKELTAWVDGESLASALRTQADQLGAAQSQRLLEHFLKSSEPEYWKVYEEKVSAISQLQAFEKRLPTTMVMQDQSERRKTYVLVRGQYDQPSDEVTAGIPQVLSTHTVLESNEADLSLDNRLDFARWLVGPQNTLTARVTVNRLWRQIFGVGIVKTTDDLGTQGEWPSHLELLDELAIDFQRSDWDTKYLLRRIANSATYRQSSRVAPEIYERDVENRLLGRGPRFRLEGEAVRDQALFVAGLLSNRLGGASVKPYQPPGLWEAVSYNGDHTNDQDYGE